MYSITYYTVVLAGHWIYIGGTHQIQCVLVEEQFKRIIYDRVLYTVRVGEDRVMRAPVMENRHASVESGCRERESYAGAQAGPGGVGRVVRNGIGADGDQLHPENTLMGCGASTAVQADGAQEDSVQRVLVQPATAPNMNFEPDSGVVEVCLSPHDPDVPVAALTGRCINAGQKQDETCAESGYQKRQV